MTYALQVLSLAVINTICAAGAYLAFSTGRVFACFGLFFGVGGIAAGCISNAVPGIYPGLACLLGGAAAALFASVALPAAARLEGFEFTLFTLCMTEVGRVLVINCGALGGALGFRAVATSINGPLSFALWVFPLIWVLGRSPWQAALLQVRASGIIAKSLGINTSSRQFEAGVASAFLLGIAGGLYLFVVGIIEPHMFGIQRSLEILVYPLLGGFRLGVWGAVGVAAILTVATEFLRFSTSSRLLLYGGCLVIAAILQSRRITEVK